MRDMPIQRSVTNQAQNLDHQPRLAYLEAINGNGLAPSALFQRNGELQEDFISLLKMLPLSDKSSGTHLVDTLAEKVALNIHEIESALQAAFFKPNAALFSFEVAADGGTPSAEQILAFTRFGLIDEIRIQAGAQYDTGVVFGGLLAAIDGRSKFLLDQDASLSSIALLGGKRALIPERELGQALENVIGEVYFAELAQAGTLPTTEYELMLCVWESYCRKNPALKEIPVIAINSDLRLGHIKEAPGTPDTVVDLANTLTSGSSIAGLSSAPTTFLLASSQPHAIRQREDFVSAMALLNYPGLAQVDIVGYANQANVSLKLYSQEVAKLVHAQYVSRYSSGAAD
jgi:hypothetical protein